ncbi:hypothetical protein TSUD_83670 [Trifolium subterraneum]|uniref:WAT1-related protein n=1 Tax=Trifolium subterraneum TaxID=3900 RepID=A0A2Z6MFB5_TRISU|nr:hypothetical protein TSUD_83670 [Trifolium subterraneum]
MEVSRKRPKMTWRVFNLSLLSGLFAGLLFQNLFYGALVLAQATLVSAIYNLVPSITFVLAVSFGLEKLNWGAATGKAKVAGTILGLAGALLLIFYKGFEFDIWPFAINLLDPNKSQTEHVTDTTSELLGFIVERDLNEWKLGWDVRLITVTFSGILASGVMLLVMAWVVQTKGPLYASAFNPLMLLFVAFVASMILDEKLNLGSILGGALIVCGLYTVLWGKGFIVERDLNEWKLGWDVRLFTVAFSGILASGVMLLVMSWVVQTKGPLYASAFNPLMLLFVAFVASMILDEKLNLGSILGGALIVCGLYTVLWGKGRELQKKIELEPTQIIGDFEATRPLLSP